jgi:hypothetical protein
MIVIQGGFILSEIQVFSALLPWMYPQIESIVYLFVSIIEL